MNGVWRTTLRFTRSGVLRDTQAVHRTVYRLLGERGLWASPDGRHLLLQGRRAEPDWPGVIVVGAVGVRTVFESGERLRIALVANPTRRLHVYNSRGPLLPLPVDEAPAWLRRKLADAVTLHEVDAHDLGTRGGQRGSGRVAHRLTLMHATGTVTDPAALAAHVRAGVGRGKAYGAGMLVIA